MKTRTQSELGRKEYVMDSINWDNDMIIEDRLRELEELPETYINSIYNVSYDEMTNAEIKECKDWIKSKF